MKALLERRDELLDALRARMPEWEPELSALVDRVLTARLQAAKRLSAASCARSREMRAGIERALDGIDVTRHGAAAWGRRRIERWGAQAYGLPQIPDIRLIRAVVKEKKEHLGLMCTHIALNGVYASTTTST